MKEKVIKLLLLCGTIPLLLVSCNLIELNKEALINSKLLGREVIPEINSETVGLVWKTNSRETNISNVHAGNIIGTGVADPCVVKVDETYHIWYTGISKVNGNNFYTIRYAYSADGIAWKNDNPSNIVLAPTAASLDNGGVRVGAVIWDNESEEFKMWYRGQVNDGSTNNGKWYIYFARSKRPDDGWIKHPNTYESTDQKPPTPVIKPRFAFENNSLGDLTAIKERYYDGYRYYYCYKIWYAANGDKSGTPSFPLLNRIMFATSADGITWDKATTPVLESQVGIFDIDGQVNPTVIKDLKDGAEIYKMWYIGGPLQAQTKQGTLGIAYSYAGDAFDYPTKAAPDNYTLEKGISSITDIKEPWVIRDGYIYKMWYTQDETGDMISTIKYVESM